MWPYSRICEWFHSCALLQPTGHSPTAEPRYICLCQADSMDHQRDYRPPGDKLKPNVRPIEYQSDHQNDHIRIAPGRNQPELRIELSPHMDVHAEGDRTSVVDGKSV